MTELTIVGGVNLENPDSVRLLLQREQMLGARMAQDFLAKGAIWDIIIKNELWKTLNYKDLSELCQNYGRCKRTAQYYRQVYEIFNECAESLEGLTFKKLIILAPAVKELDYEQKKEWIERAKAEDWDETTLRDEVKRVRGKQTQVDCEHQDQGQKITVYCRTCGKALSKTEG